MSSNTQKGQSDKHEAKWPSKKLIVRCLEKKKKEKKETLLQSRIMISFK